MTSSRPYLLRAFYEWIVDNHATPYVVVNADLPGVDVPRDYVENGRIILNISPSAVKELSLTNEYISFNARFAGVPHDIYVPVRAITAVYAKENGRGMVFKEDEDDDFPPSGEGEGGSGSPRSGSGSGDKPKGGNGRPKLTVVK